jgi:hypothetical protein
MNPIMIYKKPKPASLEDPRADRSTAHINNNSMLIRDM